MDEANDNTIVDEAEVVNAADVPTVGIWRSTLPPFTHTVPTPSVEPAERAPSLARDTWLMVAAFAVLLAVALASIGFAIGYASGHRNASTPPAATTTTAQSAWHVVWQRSGHGHELVTPPALTTQDSPRILLAWTCSNSPAMPTGTTTMAVGISQPANSQAIPLASVSCPGYGNVALSVGGDVIANTLHYGAYSVTMDASGDAPWTLQVERNAANQ